MGLWKRLTRGQFFRRFLTLLCLFVAIFCILVLLCQSLPEITPSSQGRVMASESRQSENKLGELGVLMISMLPDNLAFTVFAPSDEAFEQVLKLQPKKCLMPDKMNNTFAILSRIMGFSTVPRHVPSNAMPILKELPLDSVSGFRIDVWKMSDGTLLANNIRSNQVDFKKAEIIVHIMGGVIMDADFELSFIPDY